MDEIPDEVTAALETLLSYTKEAAANWQNGDVVYIKIYSCLAHGTVETAVMAVGRPEGVTSDSIEHPFGSAMMWDANWQKEQS